MRAVGGGRQVDVPVVRVGTTMVIVFVCVLQMTAPKKNIAYQFKDNLNSLTKPVQLYHLYNFSILPAPKVAFI